MAGKVVKTVGFLVLALLLAAAMILPSLNKMKHSPRVRGDALRSWHEYLSSYVSEKGCQPKDMFELYQFICQSYAQCEIPVYIYAEVPEYRLDELMNDGEFFLQEIQYRFFFTSTQDWHIRELESRYESYLQIDQDGTIMEMHDDDAP